QRGRRYPPSAGALILEEISMVRRLITTMVLVSMLTATGASAAGMDKCPAQGGTIRAAMAGSPPTLDFITSFAAQARDMGVYIYEGPRPTRPHHPQAPPRPGKRARHPPPPPCHLPLAHRRRIPPATPAPPR